MLDMFDILNFLRDTKGYVTFRSNSLIHFSHRAHDISIPNIIYSLFLFSIQILLYFKSPLVALVSIALQMITRQYWPNADIVTPLSYNYLIYNIKYNILMLKEIKVGIISYVYC